MKLNNLAVPKLTTYEFRDPATNEKLGFSFTGYVPYSQEWKDCADKLDKFKAKKMQKIEIEKDSGNQIINIDREETKLAEERQLRLYSKMVTKVEGLDDLHANESELYNFFKNPAYAPYYKQWRDWLDDDKNWGGVNFTKPANSAESGLSTTHTTEQES